MIKRNSSLNMKALMEDINRTSRILKHNILREDYGMDGQDPQMQQQQYMGDEEELPEDEMDEQPEVNDETVDVINQIRELAIQGIAQFANDVESEQYQALKKIWLLTDKFYEGMNEDEEKSKKF